MGGIKLGVQPRPHWRPPTQCDRGGADTETHTHMNILRIYLSKHIGNKHAILLHTERNRCFKLPGVVNQLCARVQGNAKCGSRF